MWVIRYIINHFSFIIMNTLRIGQKVLNLNEMTNNGIKLPEFYETFVIDNFEFRFEYDFETINTYLGDEMFKEEFKVLTELVEVVNLDTNQKVELNENQSKLVLKVAQSKI